MIEKNDFLKKYKIDQNKFDSAQINWDDLAAIYNDYEDQVNGLETTALYISERLRSLSSVHSLRIRLKDPEHLIEKIIRKKSENNSIDINPANYKEKVTDLIGVRALHLFKENWESIHDFIIDNWELHEPPTANVRKGDSEEFINKFKNKDCEINEHKFGYRSVHYIVESKPGKQLHYAEIQVRTIFEEGFSEIDHQVRYPYDQDNLILGSYLAIFNRLAGSADEMGSFVKSLKQELSQKEKAAKKLIDEREELTTRLKEHVAKLQIAQEEKEKLQSDLDSLNKGTHIFMNPEMHKNISSTLDEPLINFTLSDKLYSKIYDKDYVSIELDDGKNRE